MRNVATLVLYGLSRSAVIRRLAPALEKVPLLSCATLSHTPGSTMTSADVPVFIISRWFSAPTERIYDAWADPTKMADWSGPQGSSVEIVQGSQTVGRTTITRTVSPGGPEMFSLCLWRELTPHSRVVWEQSFCTREGVKCPPPFFDNWPRTLLTEVSLQPRDGGSFLTLTWTPIE